MKRNKTYNKKKTVIVFAVCMVMLAGLAGRIFYLMVIRSEYYTQKADDLHERERKIKAARGKIIDRSGVVLADNRSVCTISVIHSQIKEPKKVIDMLVKELELSPQEARERVEKVSSIERIKTNVPKETGDRIREYDLDGVKVDEDFKRYYPFDDLASRVLGFTGGDNQGIIGLEVQYDSILEGINGRILTTTDARGVAASDPLPLGRYLVREVTAPAYYQLSDQTFDVTLEYAGQILKLAAYNDPAELDVTIVKTGPKEVLAGSKITYQFTVANGSNVALSNFFWHDKLPYDITSASTLITGTYNQRLTYQVLYKTNYNGYRVLASNLLTTNTYSFSLNALPLMQGEVVTDVYFDFGTVPAGFQSMSKPMLTVSVSPQATNGYYVTNRADAGGQYLGTWETGNTAWVTIVRNLNSTPKPTLPQTGY